MLIEFFARGTGGGAGPVNYCNDVIVPEFDPITRKKIPGEWKVRDPAPEVLRGDPERMIMLIDSSTNKWKYTSGAIPFADTDNPSEADIVEVMDDFERVAFAGLQREQYDIMWTRHLHEGNVELHFVTPRLDLLTGKALNIAPPGYEAMFDAWRDTWNFKKGWASPDEPERARLGKQDDLNLKMDAELVRRGMAKAEDPKRLITEYLLTCVESGKVRDRDDVLTVLADAGIEVNRAGKDYISVRPEPGAKPVRLKGALYDAGFKIEFDRADALRAELGLQFGGQAKSQDGAGSSRNPERDAERVSSASAALARFVDKRSEFNRGRYRVVGDENSLELGRDREGSRENVSPDHGIDAVEGRASRQGVDGITRGLAQQGWDDAGRPGRRDEELERTIEGRGRSREANAGSVYPSIGGDRDSGRSAAIGREGSSAGADATASMDHEIAGVGTPVSLPAAVLRSLGLDRVPDESGRAARAAGGPAGSAAPRTDQSVDPGILRDASGQEGLHVSAEVEVTPWFEAAKEKAKDLYDRVRTAVVKKFVGALDTIRLGYGAVGRAEFAFAGAGESLVVASVGLSDATRRADAGRQDLDRCVQQSRGGVDRGIQVMVAQRDDELGRFKRDVNLVEYAESQGYEVTRSESSRSSTVMRRGDDKIIVATAEDGHGIYFSVRDDLDNGSIVDFVQKRQGLSLGQVRKELRPWASASSSYRPPLTLRPQADRPRKPVPSSRDRQQVLAAWMKMAPAEGRHAHLESARLIQPATLVDPRFVSMVRQDTKGNAVFPHYDAQGLTGYELKNDGFTGFSKNGSKAVWHSANLARAERVVIVESAIDALSHAQLSRNVGEGYVSIGGAMSDAQRELVRSVMTKAAERGAVLVIATDADEPGQKLAKQLAALAPPGAKIERQQPTMGKDWNDQVKAIEVAQVQAEKERSRQAERSAPGMSR